MFGLLGNITKAAIGTALTPIAVVKDTLTLPFDVTEDDEVYEDTQKCAKAVGEALEDIFNPDEW